MQQPRLISYVENWVVDLITRWCHFVLYKTAFQCAESHAVGFSYCEDVDSQTWWPEFFAATLYIIIDIRSVECKICICEA